MPDSVALATRRVWHVYRMVEKEEKIYAGSMWSVGFLRVFRGYLWSTLWSQEEGVQVGKICSTISHVLSPLKQHRVFLRFEEVRI